jgi:protein-disulfide isomerase
MKKILMALFVVAAIALLYFRPPVGGQPARDSRNESGPTSSPVAPPGAPPDAAAPVASASQPAQPIDTSALHPPAGSRMALVVFEDLECPACAKADPLLVQAVHDYNIPLVRHDFLIPSHPWSPEAHVIARFFDTQSPQLGEQFRQYIFANQNAIYKTNLRSWADKFAAAHHTALPELYDSSGALRAKVTADSELGKSLGIRQTPTIYVVSNSPQMPYVQVSDQAKLFETIDQVKAALGPAPKAAKKK